jgi:hypothetical protein
MITTIWAIYCSISQLFAIFIAFAQIDLMLVRMCSDITANLVTTSLYLQEKTYDKEKFKMQDENINGGNKDNYGNLDLEEEMNELSRDSVTLNNNNKDRIGRETSTEESSSVRSSISFDGCDRDRLLVNQESKKKRYKIFAISKKIRSTPIEGEFQEICKTNAGDANGDYNESDESNHRHISSEKK